jgi:hypothetical protein
MNVVTSTKLLKDWNSMLENSEKLETFFQADNGDGIVAEDIR